MWNGLLYNEFFAIPQDWFGSCYDLNTRMDSTTTFPLNSPGFSFPQKNGADCVYPFGVDPAWYVSPSLLTVTNSIKMKISVIIAVFHMSTGIMVKGLNNVFRKEWLALVFEVIFGYFIFWGLFGWMDFLIFSKWTYTVDPYVMWSDDAAAQANFIKINTAPSIISLMINNFLAAGKNEVTFVHP